MTPTDRALVRPRAPGANTWLVLTQQPANDDGQRLSEFCTTYKKKAGAKGMTKRPKQEKPPRPPLIRTVCTNRTRRRRSGPRCGLSMASW